MKPSPLRQTIVGIIITLAVFLMISYVFNVSAEDVLSISIETLSLAIVLNLARFAAQRFRLHLLLKKYSNVSHGYFDSFVLRGASEFFALTTIPFLADEAARTWLLTQRGERASRAFWIAFTEMIFDIMVGALIALAAGVYASINRAATLGFAIVLVSVFQLSAAMVLVTFGRISARNAGNSIINSIPIMGKIRGWLSESSEEYRHVIGLTFSGRGVKTLAILLTATVVVMFTPAVILYTMLGSPGLNGFLASLFTFHAGNALGVIPVTVGGAGLTEAGVYFYLSGVFGVDSAAVVIRWRLSTYYVSLIMSGLFFATAIFRNRKSS